MKGMYGRENIYITAHVHHIEGLSETELQALRNKLFFHASQEKYKIEVQWPQPGNGDLGQLLLQER